MCGRHRGTPDQDGWNTTGFFRKHAASNPSTQWSELNPSLHASTILSCSSLSLGCGLCHEPDHASGDCAMKALFPQSVVSAIASGHPPVPIRQLPVEGSIRHISRPETLERICVSWNRGRCTIPPVQFQAHLCHMQKEGAQSQGLLRDTSQFLLLDDNHFNPSRVQWSK